jgi:release factor glutamine methyltransferase
VRTAEARLRIRDWLGRARALGVERLDAQLLLAFVLDRPRAWLLAHDDEEVAPTASGRLDALLRRRAAGAPLAYLTGRREFRGLTLEVNEAVLVPRPETEGLVDWALGLPFDDVVDLGTGSGAIALAIKQARPAAAVCATDCSAAALDVARRNAARLALAIEFRAGDWWAALAGRRFALALSNPPYIAGGDPHLAALGHEPRVALTPGGDGLGALRAIVAGAPAHLVPGGWLLLEHGHDQAGAVSSLLRQAGFEPVQTRADLAGLPRCTGGRRPD